MKPIIAANWKMHKTNQEVKKFLELLVVPEGVEVWIAPAATALVLAAEYGVTVGAQNVSEESEGALTGEISARQVASAGAKFVIVGHSERRRLFGETEEMVAKKVQRIVECGLTPLLCVGETMEERREGKTREVLMAQLVRGFKGVVAYEPVWAIGTGERPSGEMIEEAHRICKEVCPVPVLYGGSVTPESAGELKKLKGIDGVLVGGAALDVGSFLRIIEEFRR